jgi:hypothetical protein
VCSCGGPRRGVKYAIDCDYNEVLAGTRQDDDPSALTLAYGLQFATPLTSITAIKSAMCRKVRVCVCVCVCAWSRRGERGRRGCVCVCVCVCV